MAWIIPPPLSYLLHLLQRRSLIVILEAVMVWIHSVAVRRHHDLIISSGKGTKGRESPPPLSTGRAPGGRSYEPEDSAKAEGNDGRRRRRPRRRRRATHGSLPGPVSAPPPSPPPPVFSRWVQKKPTHLLIKLPFE